MTQALANIAHARFYSAALQLVDAKGSPATRKAYRHELGRWAAYCDGHAIDPTRPALGHSVAFRDWLLAEISKESTHRALAALSSLYRALLAGGLVAGNPFHPSVLAWPPQSSEGKTPSLSDEQAIAVLARVDEDPTAVGLRDAAILRIMFDTGLRRESVATLERAHYKPPMLRATVKGGKQREIALLPETQERIDRWLARAPSSRYLFPGIRNASNATLFGDSHIGVSTVSDLVWARGRAAGIDNLHPHRFRAAFITAAYDAGIPEYEIQAAAGHSDPKTTRRYDRGTRGLAVASKVAEFRNKRKDK